jgi:CheY-like chemotaxis protein/anti-sigma regulatory factor (Ser/Thr protein kinase)
VIGEALESVRPAAEAKRVELEVQLDISEPLYGDPDRLRQVVWNLLSNAIKFTPSGGRVSVRAITRGDTVQLEVSDTGQGIDPEFVPHVFDPFRQASGGTTRSHGGIGLGLAIVKQIVQAHGGTIEAASDGPGRGARFVVDLPIRARAQVLDRPSPSTEQNQPLGAPNLEGIKVLLVDDDEDGLELVRSALALRGATVATARNAEAALEQLSAFAPELLVSDIAMPENDGYDLIRRVRERGADVPAIALTAHAGNDTRAKAVQAGFQHLQPKPIDLNQLASAIARIVRGPAAP